MAEAPLIKTFRSGATGLILSLCNEIKLVEHINQTSTILVFKANRIKPYNNTQKESVKYVRA